MPIYVALLRGINLGPHRRMKMERLRESFEALGFSQVQTLIQSGNVVFKAAKMSEAALCRKIEAQILADFGFSAAVLLRTREEMSKAVAGNPFSKKPGAEAARLHVSFLPESPSAEALKALEGMTKPPDEARCLGRELYLHLPNGMSKSSLINNPVERKWLKGATTRNWNTVSKLHQMCQACE